MKHKNHEWMDGKSKWIGFHALNKLNHGIVCKAMDNLVNNSRKMIRHESMLLWLLLLKPVLFWLLLSNGPIK